jgi:formiminoglutamate deiminase
MTILHAQAALLDEGLTRDVRVTIDGSRIANVEAGVAPAAGDERVGLLAPGIASLHSHAFQRGMAGLAEARGAAADSFWTWRETMYRFALGVSPDQLNAIAAQLYVEMLEAGFTRVGEFHYLHHDMDGRPYDDIAELAGQLCAAAGETGIDLTLLPAFYAHSTFGGAAPLPEQRRFICGLDDFARLVDGCRQHAAGLDSANVGVAPHSLRAVTPQELAMVAQLAADAPVHIHAAEQTQEVEACIAWSGKRPVEWLLDHAGVDGRWCLIHATHMTGAETERLARSGATAGVCPVTEASLGDGVFNGPAYLAAGGAFGVGTDSNVLIGAADELRQLEYSQRLFVRGRNILAAGAGSTGRALLDAAVRGGNRALGAAPGVLSPGARANLIAIDIDTPTFAGASTAQLFDVWIFASRGAVDRVWVGGRKVVEGGRHIRREAIAPRFTRALKELATT